MPDETTILNFRHLLERHDLTQALFDRMNAYLASRGLQVKDGTIVDGTIIAAPNSTKNQTEARDPEMRQTRKGRQWYFGMKLHVGADSKTKLIHSMTTTAANVHDANVLGQLLHGKETRVYGDQAYRGQKAVIRKHAPRARDFTNRRYRHRRVVRAWQEPLEVPDTSQGRARHRGDQAGVQLHQGSLPGTGEETHRARIACGLANLFIARRQLLPV